MSDPVRRAAPDRAARETRADPRGRRIPVEASEGGDHADLVARVRQGERAALTTIFRAYYVGLCEFAVRYVRADDLAEELVQDVFAAIWANRADWVVRGTVRSYLYGAVRNRAVRSTARAALAQRWADGASREAMESPRVVRAVDAEYEATEVAAIVARALEQLPARRREAYILRREHDLSTAEVAGIMGISRKAVEMHLMRVLKALRAALGLPRAH